jgi:hypothetical protein
MCDHFITAGQKPSEIYLDLIIGFLPMYLNQFKSCCWKEREYYPETA